MIRFFGGTRWGVRRSTLVGGLALLVGFSQAANGDLLMLLEGDVDSGSVAVDSSGNNNHGIYVGDSGTTANGRTGGALNFNDAADTYAVFNQTPIGSSLLKASDQTTSDSLSSINANQEFSIGFWMAGGESNPRNTSVFWAEGPEGTTNRAFQSHATWSNGSIFLDIGGCCAGDTQRISGALEEEHIKASVGNEWSHITYTYGEDPEIGGIFRRIYVNGELYDYGGAGLAEAETLELPEDGAPGHIPLIERMVLASERGVANFWEGRMDDLFLTDNALSPADVSNIFNNSARAHFNVEGTPDTVAAQFIVANEQRGSYTLDAVVSNQMFSDGPVEGQGLTQYWYDGNMGPGGNSLAGEAVGGSDAFLEARSAGEGGVPGGTDDYPLIAGNFVAGQWVGGQAQPSTTQTLPRYPEQVAGMITNGTAENHNQYGVIAQGEIWIPENGQYIIRDGIDDFTMIAIDQDGDGELAGIEDVFDTDFGNLGIDNALDDVVIADNDWSNANGSGNPVTTHGGPTFTDIPEGGAWRKIELWMAEGTGGDAGIIYMGKADDPDLFDINSEDALTPEQIEKFLLPAENLRGEGIVLVSADADAALNPGFEYVMQVGADGTHDSINIGDNGGLYDTTLDVSGANVTIEAEEGIADGTVVQIFGANNVVGIDSLSLNFADASQWDLSSLATGQIVFGGGPVCNPNTSGDLDGNGTVEFADFLTLSANFGQNVSSHTDGDIDCDGEVAFSDFLTLSANFGTEVGGAESVPEPSGLALLSLAAMGCGLLRRRRN